MIANERQYRITSAWLEKFEQGAARAEEAAAGLDPLFQRAMRDQYVGQADELRSHLAEYEALRAGRVATIPLHSMADLPTALIKARIAAGLTHKQLAEQLHVSEQQVQRDEMRHYKGVSLERLIAVSEALGVRTRGSLVLPRRAGTRRSTPRTSPVRRHSSRVPAVPDEETAPR